MRTQISLISLLLILVCLGCTTPKFYTEIESTYSKEKKDDYVSKSSIKHHKIVFGALKDKLKNSEHIIYHYAPNAEWNRIESSGVVYDVDNSKYYYLENSIEHPHNLIISDVIKYQNDEYNNSMI